RRNVARKNWPVENGLGGKDCPQDAAFVVWCYIENRAGRWNNRNRKKKRSVDTPPTPGPPGICSICAMPASFTRRKTVRQSITAFIAALALAPAVSVAQADYPNRPVRVYVASTAGGPLDIVTRGAANWWSRRLGQSFVVEAKPG